MKNNYLKLLTLYLLYFAFFIPTYTNKPVFISLLILVLSNFCLSLMTQFFHANLGTPHVFDFSTEGGRMSAVLRTSAGVGEMVLYTFSFLIGLPSIVVGYLIIKSLSVWKSPNPDKEGGSAAILRIAVIISLFISFGVAIYLLNSSFVGTAAFSKIDVLRSGL